MMRVLRERLDEEQRPLPHPRQRRTLKFRRFRITRRTTRLFDLTHKVKRTLRAVHIDEKEREREGPSLLGRAKLTRSLGLGSRDSV